MEMETRITATELAKSLSDILNRVRYRGERFRIERNGEPIATLVPAAPVSGDMTMGKLVALLKDLPSPDEDFADDLEAIHSSQPKVLVQVRELDLASQLRLLEELAALIRHRISVQPKHSVLELQGLGKEIWEGIDAQEYVDRERASWGG
jgi:prevent-host-death family protein